MPWDDASGLPFVWPTTTGPTAKSHGIPAWVNIPDPHLDVSTMGIVWGLDSNGVRFLRERLQHDFPRLRVKLLVAVYAASPTRSEVLQELLALIETLEGRLEASLFVLSLENNASPMSALCFSELKSGRSYLWIGNSRNLAWDAAQAGHLNFGLECEPALVSQWLNWFVGAWIESTPLTPLTANVPALVPATGTKEAADSWREYERFCRQLGTPEEIDVDTARPDAEGRNQDEDESKRQLAVAAICTEMGISPPDRLQEEIARLMAKGQVVTVDQSSRTPPLELPLSKWLQLGELGTERIVVSGEARLRVFDEKESKEIEKLRKGVAGLIDHLTYPLADRVRWMPLAAKPLFERERTRLEMEAKQRLGDLVKGDISAFVKSRRPQIEQDANEVYAKFHPNERLPSGTINLILRDLEDRLGKATGENFLPKVSYATQQFFFGVSTEHATPWAPARALLAAVAEYARRAVSKKGHLRGHDIPEEELLEAMNVCDDHILRTHHDLKIVHGAKRELVSLEEILTDDSDDRSKCDRILRLIQASELALGKVSPGQPISGGPARPGAGREPGEHSERAGAQKPASSAAEAATAAEKRMRDRMAQRAVENGEEMSPNQGQQPSKKEHLYPGTLAALGKLSPELLKLELAGCLGRVVEEYSEAGQELVDRAELGDNVYLEDLLEQVQAADPVSLVNELVKANPELNLKNLQKMPPLEPLKAVLVMYLNADR